MPKAKADKNCCKSYFGIRLFKEETGWILNYVTLQITEPEVAKDLGNHMVE